VVSLRVRLETKDLKRVLHLANHFGISHGIVINKFNLSKTFCSKIEDFAKEGKIPIIGKIPYRKDFLKSTVKMKPVAKINPKYKKCLKALSMK
jgi:MinD superfamily P-loop ATPase